MPTPQMSTGGNSSRVTLLALGVWLSAAAMTAGCYMMNGDAPQDAESKRALRALKRHLRASLPGAKFFIEQLPVSVPGWTLFAGEDQDVRHGSLCYWVVRANGSVVTEEPLAELSRAYRSLEAVRPAPLASPEDLSWIAVALLDRDQQLLDRRRHQQLRGLYDSDELAPPQLMRHGDWATLVFWVTVGRGRQWGRYELQISADYQVTVSVTSPQLPQRDRRAEHIAPR